jgi:hypothetical protein
MGESGSMCIKDWFKPFFFSKGSTALRGPRPRDFSTLHEHTLLDTPHSVGLLWTSDQPNAETSTWQSTTQTDIHALGGIRTHNRSKRAAADPRLRPHGQWDRRFKPILPPFITWLFRKLKFLIHMVDFDPPLNVINQVTPIFVQTGPGANPASCTMWYRVISGGKAAGAWRWPPTSI